MYKQESIFTDSTWHIGNFIFGNGHADKYLFPGGYYSYAEGHPSRTGGDGSGYYYCLTDHLGNNRVVVNANGDIEQTTHYYPFGAVYADAGKNPDFQKFKYTGKELDLTHGLNTYDHGARQNYSILGVWDRIDPMAEKYYNFSPYVVCGNNPIRMLDSNGKWHWDKEGNLIAEGNDDDRTLSHFFNISNKESLEILAHNNIKQRNGKIKIQKGRLLPKSTLFSMRADEKGVVVHNTEEAVIHYYSGNGEPADVGDVSTAELMNSKEFQNNLKATTTQKKTYNALSVDMTNSTFHIGRTPVSYEVSPGKNVSRVTFTLFKGDSFKDPLDVGIEVGGTPYPYKSRTIIYFFKPVK